MSQVLERVSARLARVSASFPLGDNPMARISMRSAPQEEEWDCKIEKMSSAELASFVDTDGVERSGGVLTAVGHTLTAVMGAGILNLPYAVSMLGWVAGPVCILVFAWITLYTSQLLADCAVINGRRQRNYTQVVYTTFGNFGCHLLGWVQHSNLFVTTLSYQITAALSLQQIATSVCAANGSVNCFDSYWKWSIIFAAVQLVMVQLPDLSYFWWASLVGAAMAIGYSFIALGLSISAGNTHGTVGGQSLSPSPKAFGVLNALGSVLFAYAFSMILIEIQDTVASRPGKGPIKPMRRAVNISVALMTSFYMAVSVAGYMAFGNDVPANILTGFLGPVWVVVWANVMVVIHMIAAYQVYAQPLLVFAEMNYEEWDRAPEWTKKWLLRATLRPLFVVVICVLGICLPFFNDIVGLVGAIGFWPATVYFPIECWIRIYKPDARKRIWLRVLNVASFIVTVAALIGSVQLIVVDSSSYQPFG